MVTTNGGDETIYPEPGVTKVLSKSVAKAWLCGCSYGLHHSVLPALAA